ncbi:MAG: DUF6159 family protein [Nitrospira sp.]|nr:DUF6159 family protein [Nitrospira sp.]
MSSWTQRIVTTQAILAAAWRILKEEKTLLLLPLASSVCVLLLTAVVAAPAIIEGFTGMPVPDDVPHVGSANAFGLFFLYVSTYGVGVFFNAALALAVLRKFEGRSESVSTALSEAVSLLPQIVGWAVVSATVGVLLKGIERRSGMIGGLVVRMLGLAWSVATFLVVPVLVAQRTGPFDAIKESVQLLRRTWGENILAGLGFGVLYFFWALPGVFAFVIGAGLVPTHLATAILIMALAICYFPVLGLVLSTLSTIFDVVLYRYAKFGAVAPGFDRTLLEASFTPKTGSGR